MRSLLTGGIKAILALAALSTAAHWVLRVQREPAAPVGLAAIPDPVVTGSIVPRRVERSAGPAEAGPAAEAAAQAPGARTGTAARAALGPGPGLDQDHLLKLISQSATDRRRGTVPPATTRVATKR